MICLSRQMDGYDRTHNSMRLFARPGGSFAMRPFRPEPFNAGHARYYDLRQDDPRTQKVHDLSHQVGQDQAAACDLRTYRLISARIELYDGVLLLTGAYNDPEFGPSIMKIRGAFQFRMGAARLITGTVFTFENRPFITIAIHN